MKRAMLENSSMSRLAPPTSAPSTFGSRMKEAMFAAFTAVCVGLLRIFLRRGFVTPESAGRVLDLPVLAVAPLKAS